MSPIWGIVEDTTSGTTGKTNGSLWKRRGYLRVGASAKHRIRTGTYGTPILITVLVAHMSEKSHSACNGMVQHVTLGQLWSASKVWQRDLEPVSSRLKALCAFQAVPSRPKLWSPCEKPSAGLHQGPGPSAGVTPHPCLLVQVIDYLLANNDYYNNSDCKEPLLVEKNGSILIFVTFRESSQKVLEPLTWLGSGWRILNSRAPLLATSSFLYLLREHPSQETTYATRIRWVNRVEGSSLRIRNADVGPSRANMRSHYELGVPSYWTKINSSASLTGNGLLPPTVELRRGKKYLIYIPSVRTSMPSALPTMANAIYSAGSYPTYEGGPPF
ncbi:hypothetical protein K438DRAFT_1790052 [Mycena galopus ATCC 62051]|nr:hypothetical protein K438DRAFT_1790052 [Mycena galopus ATCC 62051]